MPLLWPLTIGLLVPSAPSSRPRRLAVVVVLLLLAGFVAPAVASAGPAPDRVAAPERVLLALDATSNEARAQVVGRVGASGARTLRTYKELPYIAVEASGAVQRRLRSTPGVTAVLPDERFSADLTASTQTVGATTAWAGGVTGSGQTVAVIDSGVDATHPMLAGKVVDEACFSLSGNCPNGGTTQTGVGAAAPCTFDASTCPHGTHVAGIVAGASATLKGVAPGARIAAVQVFSRETVDCGGAPSCAVAWTSDLLAGLDHVARLNRTTPVAAVNMSLGGGRYTGTCDSDEPALASAISTLRGLGVVTVVSSGNAAYLDAVASPACISSAVAVGASTRADGVASFSNSSAKLALLAPGERILSAWTQSQHAYASGTSQAAPHVAGAVAILRQSRPTASADQIVQALSGSGPVITDSRNGRSTRRLQVDAALTTLAALTEPTPAPAPEPTPAPAPAPAEPTPAPVLVPVSTRLSGDNRYDTAATIFSAAFSCASGGASSAVIARGDAFADALAGSYLAGSRDTGVLLTATGSVPTETLAALRTSGARSVVLLGGTAAISDAVAAQLAATPSYACDGTRGAPLQVIRINGNDRYDTARRTAEYAGVDAVGTADPAGRGSALRTAVVASGAGFADALAAGPLSYSGAASPTAGNQRGFPTLLTGAGSLAPEAEAALRTLQIQQVIIPGGTAVVAAGTESRLRELGLTVIRLAGNDRMETAAEVARFSLGDRPGYPVGLDFDRSAVTLARGDAFADALAGAAYAGDRTVPLLLTAKPDALGAATATYLRSVAGVTGAVTAFGGNGAVTSSVLSDAVAALTN